VEYVLLAGPTGGATLDLDHHQFPLAGDFVQPRGAAVAREASGDGEVAIAAATAFDPDRSDGDAVRIRAITVRDDRRGEGIGARLAAFTRAALHGRGWDRVLIAVATPVGYHALHKAGFADTGETTGLRERVLAHPPPADPVPYATGLRWYLDHDPSSAERAFVTARAEGGPPDPVPVPSGRSEASPR
jgi:GNAT superfamily N-acetyltransferase